MNSNEQSKDDQKIEGQINPLPEEGKSDFQIEEHEEASRIESNSPFEQDDAERNGVERNYLEGLYAGFWMRFWAYLLDLVVIGSVQRLIVYPVFRALDLSLVEESIFSPITIATAVVFYAYFVFMTKFYRQTIGKMVFGMKVVALNGEKLSWGTVMFREWIGRFISATVFILYVVVAFTKKKQGIHDLFADTTVIYEPR